MTPKNLLSEAAQRLIDEHREEQAADASLEELLAEPSSVQAGAVFPSKAALKASKQPPPMYTPEALVELMVKHPQYTHAEFAAHFGYKASWFAAVLISDRFQKVLEPRRHEVSNPMLTGTMQDLLRSMMVQSLDVLQTRLSDPKASEDLIIKALNSGVKALGMGTPGQVPDTPPVRPTLSDLASKLSTPKQIPATPARDWTIEASLQELPK